MVGFSYMSALDAARRFGMILSDSWTSTTEIHGRLKTGLPKEEARFPVMKRWADRVLSYLDLHLTQTGETPSAEPAILVGNHISYVDIPVMMAATPVVFIAKRQIGSWPVFGRACRSVGTVLVDRDDKHSRKKAADTLGHHIKTHRQSVVVFPSGTTTMHEEKPWRWGAFAIAKRYGIPVQPFRLTYRPPERVAYLMEHTFVPHLWHLLSSGGRVECRLEFGKPRLIEDPHADCESMYQWVKSGL